MNISERRQRWTRSNTLTPHKLSLARQILHEIRGGREVLLALRSHPLEGGGYLTKAALVAAYQEMVEAGSLSRRWTSP